MPPLQGLSIGDRIREQRQLAQLSLRQLADASGISNPYLSQIERGLRSPSTEVISQIAKGLGITAGTLFAVSAQNGNDLPGVLSAIHADPSLDERQKRILIEMYMSFQQPNPSQVGSSRPDATRASSFGAAWEEDTLFSMTEVHPADAAESTETTDLGAAAGSGEGALDHLAVESSDFKEFLQALTSR
ncbi:helix-turn-helix transcriptional regulator [Streptosporangium canum]|uniref:helix-turn-helix domain-containing protein n=1 Tax=Streptosporangium canum TaxID=324952 RepID=UPI0034460243